MKKLLSLMALMGLFTFVGCGGTPEASSPETTPEQEEAYGEDVEGSSSKGDENAEGSGTTEEEG